MATPRNLGGLSWRGLGKRVLAELSKDRAEPLAPEMALVMPGTAAVALWLIACFGFKL